MINTVVGVLQGGGGVEAISGQRMEWVRFKRFPGIAGPRAKSENEHCTYRQFHWRKLSKLNCTGLKLRGLHVAKLKYQLWGGDEEPEK